MNELGQSILIVDDEPMLARALGRMLRRTFDVTVATSVTDALVRIQQNPEFSFVLSDIRMPEQDGIDLYHAVRARDPILADRVIFMTAEPSTRNLPRMQCLQNPVLSKPFGREDLFAAVKSLPLSIGAQRQRDQRGYAAG